MAYEDDIKKMYDEYYKSQYNGLVKNKENSLNQLAGQDSLINNNYTDTQAQINKAKADTANKYKDMYTQLDNTAADGKNKYYGDRNQVALQTAKNNQAIRDYMAKSNLLASGENMDAMLRQNTDYNNSMGNIYGAEQSFNKGINDTRSKYQSDETSSYVNYDNTLAAALKERDRQLAALQAQRTGIENNFNNDNAALLSDIEYKKINDINAYREKLRQEQVAAEQERIAYERQLALKSYSDSNSASTPSDSDLLNAYESDVLSNVRSGNTPNLTTSLQATNDLYRQGYINANKYNDNVALLNSSIASNALANSKIANGLYGYSAGVSSDFKNPVKKVGGSKKQSLAY